MKIAGKLIVFYGLIVVFSLVLVSVTALFIIRNEVTDRSRELLVDHAEERDRDIHQVLEMYRYSLEILASKSLVKEALFEHSPENLRLLDVELTTALEESGIRHLFAYSNENQLLMSKASIDAKTTFEEPTTFHDADYVAGGHTVTMWFEQNALGELLFFMRTSVTYEGAEVGHIVMLADHAPLYAITRNYHGLGKTGEIVLAQQLADGRLQIIFPVRFDPDSKMKILESNMNIALYEALASTGYYYKDSFDYLGQNVLAAGRKIDLTNWVLIVKMDKEEALKMLNTFQTSLGIITLMSLIISMIGGIWFSARFSHPIVAMSKAAKEIARGNYDKRVAISSNDEVGELGRSFNLMAEKLTLVLKNLEAKVKEKTTELEATVKQLQEKAALESDTKRAMINLLEDARDLQDELKREKSGVEEKVIERTKQLEEKTIALEEAREKATAGWIQLQAEKARLKASIEALPLGLLILDVNHLIIGNNDQARKIFQTTEGSEIVLADFERFLGEMQMDLPGICPHCRANHDGYYSDELMIHDHYYRLISVPVTVDGVIIGSAYLIEDITSSKMLQKTRDEFFSVASHELRTPLTAIRGNSQLLIDYFPDIMKNNEAKEMVGDIHTASIRLIQIVNDFLDASRLELKRVDMKIEKLSIKQLLERSMEEIRSVAQEKQLAWQMQFSVDESVMVMGDVQRLQQVIINLLGNAVKFTTQGGVYVDVDDVGDNRIRVKISDTGSGISEVDQQELFKKFKQVGSNAGLTRVTSQGSGMGLYISKLIMETMGGSIYLEWSELGKGSTFAIELPKA